jgi:hypothetical protein
MVQVPLATVKVTKPVPLPPVELRVDVPEVVTDAGVATATSVACATSGAEAEPPPQAAKRVAAETAVAVSSHRFEKNCMDVSLKNTVFEN